MASCLFITKPYYKPSEDSLYIEMGPVQGNMSSLIETEWRIYTSSK